MEVLLLFMTCPNMRKKEARRMSDSISEWLEDCGSEAEQSV